MKKLEDYIFKVTPMWNTLGTGVLQHMKIYVECVRKDYIYKGNGDTNLLVIGEIYELVGMNQNWDYTLFKLKNIPGEFDSVLFKQSLGGNAE